MARSKTVDGARSEYQMTGEAADDLTGYVHAAEQEFHDVIKPNNARTGVQKETSVYVTVTVATPDEATFTAEVADEYGLNARREATYVVNEEGERTYGLSAESLRYDHVYAEYRLTP